MNAFRVPAINVGFQSQFLQKELQCLVVRSLKVIGVVFFFQLKAKLLVDAGVVNP